ncbi:FMRFamide-related peptides [Sitodiplosis mosellana]|uniref:FMRFamide-related peptides n=1 Tax=Sitodiplosis mosellana TaxID=263140 RepID=UPI0024442875|nr:FMRFamide-related peptides [Sitodiplosis mosellana]
MGYKNITLAELMLLSVVLGGAFAVIETQEQLPANENQLSNLGSLSSSVSSSLSSKLSESAVPGKSSRYIIRFARTPSSMIRFSRSPSSQIRFGRSQPFVRFGRSGSDQGDDNRANSRYPENFIRFARSGVEDYYSPDESIQVEPRSGGDSGFIRFGRSQNFAPSPSKAEALRAINWRNFLRLGRNTNANIRFAGKRDGSSTANRHNAIPIEILLEKLAHDQKPVHSSNTDTQGDRNLVNEDEQPIDAIDANADQFQAAYSNGNEIEQN